MSEDPTRPMPSGWPGQPPQDTARLPGGGHPPGRGHAGRGRTGGGYGRPPRRGRARRRLTILAIVVVVLLALLVALDRGAAAYAENRAAGQIQSGGFPARPAVTISGFPFLTQVLAHDLKTVTISASNVPEGPVEIASVNATAHNVHLNSGFSGGTIDQVNGTALITFAGLGRAAGIGDGVTLSNAGRNEVKATVDLGFLSGTALAQVTRTGPHQIRVQVLSAGGIPASALGSLQDFTISVPKLPAGMTVQNVTVTDQGVVITASATNTSFSQ